MADEMRIEVDAKKMHLMLKGISEDRLDAWVDYSFYDEAFALSDFIKRQFLSGQKMKVRPDDKRRSGVPHTRDRVLPYKYKSKKEHTIVLRPGVGIPGMQNYLVRYVGTAHEFMKPAFEAFGGRLRIEKAVRENVENMLKKVQK